MARILLVEDSKQLRDYIVTFLENKGGFDIDQAPDGHAAMDLIMSFDYDLAILDIMLPGPSGFEVCKALRKRSNCPIIFLTALGNEDNILTGYEIGADEYMVKPFSLKILYAKILALLARAGIRDEKVLSCGDVRVYTQKMEVTDGDKEVSLSPKEYFLLKVLIENKGRVMKRSYLLDRVWGKDIDVNDRSVDTHIKNLRKKITGATIKTIIGSGYKIL